MKREPKSPPPVGQAGRLSYFLVVDLKIDVLNAMRKVILKSDA